MSDNDCFWMKAKRDGECAECEDLIAVGDDIVWDTKEYKAYCSTCGQDVVAPSSLDDEVQA